VRPQLGELVDRAIILLLAESFDHEAAESLGAALVVLGFCESAALRLGQEVLGRELVAGLPTEELAILHPRLVALLGAIAVDFVGRAQATLLIEPEQIHNALLAAHREIMPELWIPEVPRRYHHRGKHSRVSIHHYEEAACWEGPLVAENRERL
jgi:hypothetical protein